MSRSRPVHVEIIPRKNEPPEKVIRRFTKKVKKEGILEEVRERSYYIKPSARRRKKKRDRARVLQKLRSQRERKN